MEHPRIRFTFDLHRWSPRRQFGLAGISRRRTCSGLIGGHRIPVDVATSKPAARFARVLKTPRTCTHTGKRARHGTAIDGAPAKQRTATELHRHHSHRGQKRKGTEDAHVEGLGADEPDGDEGADGGDADHGCGRARQMASNSRSWGALQTPGRTKAVSASTIVARGGSNRCYGPSAMAEPERGRRGLRRIRREKTRVLGRCERGLSSGQLRRRGSPTAKPRAAHATRVRGRKSPR